MAAQAPPSASRYQAVSALAALHGAREALKVRAQSLTQAAATLVRYQMIGVKLAEKAVPLVLADQHIESVPLAELNPVGFTTPADQFTGMAADIEADWQFQRLVESILQETARAAQEAAIAVQDQELGWVRHLTLPSCSRCAVLAGRVYRWSDGFLRHPGCDCTMVPVREGDERLALDPVQLAREGKVTGLSKDDRRALDEGADFSKVVNVRLRSAGLTESGVVLSRRGRLTPAGIFRTAANRDEALTLLKQHAYIR